VYKQIINIALYFLQPKLDWWACLRKSSIHPQASQSKGKSKLIWAFEYTQIELAFDNQLKGELNEFTKNKGSVLLGAKRHRAFNLGCLKWMLATYTNTLFAFSNSTPR